MLFVKKFDKINVWIFLMIYDVYICDVYVFSVRIKHDEVINKGTNVLISKGTKS